MSEYLILAENVVFKNNKLTCINIYDRISVVAMPTEFKFDLAVICGPNWTVGEHKLSLKAKSNTGKELPIGELTVNIPNEDYVYNAYAHDIKMVLDYSVTSLTFGVYDNDKEVLSRKYQVVPMLVPQKNQSTENPAQQETKPEENKNE